MTVAVVGSAKGPTGKEKNCDTWAEYEAPTTSEFANLCNGGSYEGYVWQNCPSRTDCRAATLRDSRQSAKKTQLSVIGSNRSGYATSLPAKRQEAPRIELPQVIMPRDDLPYLSSPRLAPKPHYQPSPTFLPKEEEPLLWRFAKNVVQGMIHAIFHQGKELAENTDFFPHRPKQENPEE